MPVTMRFLISTAAAVLSVIAVVNASNAKDQNAIIVEKTVTFVAISSVKRCKDVRLNKAGDALVSEMSAKLRAGDQMVRSVSASAAALEMKLMTALRYGHCKNVQSRYPQFVEIVNAP